MNFQGKIADGIQQKYGHSLANAFEAYCESEKLSDETLYYDLTQMTYKWSIMEVFLIDVLLLKNKDGLRIYKYMKKFASKQSEPEPKPEYKPEIVHVSTNEQKETHSPKEKNKKPNKKTVSQKTSETATVTDTNDESNKALEKLVVGSGCEVYSVSETKWFKGKIAQIFEDEEGEWLRVTYGDDSAKDIQRYSKFLRPINNTPNQHQSKTEIEENEDKSTDNIDNQSKTEIEANDVKSRGSIDNQSNENNKNNKTKIEVIDKNKSREESEEKLSVIENITWANLVLNVSISSVFDNWKTFDYSITDDVSIQSIEKKLNKGKHSRNKFKIKRVGTFGYVKKENPKGYKIAVRCSNNSIDDAYEIVDHLKSKLDAKLKTVKKIEKFKYKQFLDHVIKQML